jgi:glycosyltransferase involved in cell wall biosynthesis
MSFALVINGEINTRTGGYIYDKNICELGSFSLHDISEITHLTKPLLVDGLAFGTLQLESLEKIKSPVTALVHHPLFMETGLTQEESERLYVSEKRALSFAKHIIVTSYTTKATLIEAFHQEEAHITVAEPGVTLRPHSTKVNVKFPSLLNVGTLSPRKNQLGLLEALLPLKNEKWHLNIVGSLTRYPEYATQVQAFIAQNALAERVTLHGECDDVALNKLYSKASLFVLSSLYEGYGMVLSEAMSAGLPIITTTGGAAGECLPQDVGLKVPPNDTLALTKALHTMITVRMERSIAAHKAFIAAKTLPTWQNTTNIILKVMAQ